LGGPYKPTPLLLRIFIYHLSPKNKKHFSRQPLNKKTPLRGEEVLVCGAGGVRTRVQTGSQKAFYMLIHSLIVGKKPVSVEPILSVVPEVFDHAAGHAQLIQAFLMLRSGHRLTRFPGEQIKLNF